ncbi:4a-hydroxytetrahydrobiopterin dehydratase [Profundibacter sp.]
MKTDLSDKKCEPCEGGIAAMGLEAASDMMGQLHKDWVLADSGAALVRRLEFKGFAKAVYHANLAAFLGDQEGHHPDIRFGWGYCEVEFTTHAAGGLTQNDFICAAKFDKMLA